MSYSTSGAKPYERASKSSHHYIVNDKDVVEALAQLHIPTSPQPADISKLIVSLESRDTAIEHIVAIDGGYTEVPIKEGYPAAAMHFFQFGALHFRIADLVAMEASQHVSPEDMQRLKSIERLKLPLASSGARRDDCSSLRESVRKTLHEFCRRERLGEEDSLLDTLAWFVFRRYKRPRSSSNQQWLVGSNPTGIDGPLVLTEKEMSGDFSFQCPTTKKDIYLIDVFRLHERIEEESGASGVAGYITGVMEHLVLLHIIRHLLKKNPAALAQVLFIMDRPTGWFGVTAPMHKLMLELNVWLFEHHNVFLAGLEKSGAFVEHAARIQETMPLGSVLVLTDEYIYKYISPGEQDPARPYAATSYYGHKVIFRSRTGQMYVVSLPVRELLKSPTINDVPNLQAILTHIAQLHCDMFENALLPVALANKLVSLSAHPSSQILKAFAKSTIPH